MRADTGSEHEFKLGAPALFEVPAPEGEHRLIPTRTVELSATYWDTADLRLAQAGVSVRHRRADDGTENGWTVKLPAGSGNGTMTSRTEVKFSGTRVRPPVGAVRLLQATTRGIALLAVAEIVTTRRGFAGNVRQDLMLVVQFNTEKSARQDGHYLTFQFNTLFHAH